MEDRRVRKTKSALNRALVDLVPARGYDRLKIGDLLEQADVSRSAFYGHFADKDDFLITSFVRMLGMCVGSVAPPTLATILPVRTLFDHIHGNKAFAVAISKASLFDAKMVAGEEKLREIATTRLAIAAPGIEPGPLAAFLAGALIGLLRWWMTRGLPEPPEELEAIFMRLAASATGSALPVDA